MLPKLRLGIKRPSGGVDSTGPHRVKFLTDATVVMGKDNEGKPRKEMRFEIMESRSLDQADYEGAHAYRWNVAIMDKSGTQPSYIIEKLMHLEIGDERILEMRQQGGKRGNYIDVRMIDEESEPPEDAEDEESEEQPHA